MLAQLPEGSEVGRSYVSCLWLKLWTPIRLAGRKEVESGDEADTVLEAAELYLAEVA